MYFIFYVYLRYLIKKLGLHIMEEKAGASMYMLLCYYLTHFAHTIPLV